MAHGNGPDALLKIIGEFWKWFLLLIIFALIKQ